MSPRATQARARVGGAGEAAQRGVKLVSVALRLIASLVLVVALVACSGGSTIPREDGGGGDSIKPPPPDGRVDSDAQVPRPDVAPPDLPPPPDPKTARNIVSGAGRSTSASYELQSQVGMPLETTLQSGAQTALRWNAAVIPW